MVNDWIADTDSMRKYILKYYHNDPPSKARNSMGCNESWYNPYYAIAKTFGEEEVNAMSNNELVLLVRLGVSMSEAFY